MGAKGKSPALNNLLKAGEQIGESVQQIKTVVDAVPIVSDPEFVSEEKVKQEAPIQTPPKKVRKSSKKGLDLLLSKRSKREKQDSETAKIPRKYHAELRTLSGMTGIGIVEMLGNIIESFFEENREAIDEFEEDFIKNKNNRVG